MKYLIRPNIATAIKKQAGAALVVALLIVFIVASLAVTVSSDFLVMFRRVENQIHGQQAYAYLVGAEGLGRSAVLLDPSWSYDHLSEGILQQPTAFANEIAQFTGTLSDIQGRININTLQSASKGTAGDYTVPQERFIRLLQTLNLATPLDVFTAEEIANAVFDWLDVDNNERDPGGAEAYYYSEATPPGRAGNRAMQSVSELRWVKGITPELYQALLPHITLWGNGKININTATEEVLRSLNKPKDLRPISQMDVAILVEAQQPEEGGYDDISVFTQPPLADLKIDSSELAVNSEMFLLSTKVLMLDREYHLYSVIFRSNDSATVIARSQQPL
ncbi:type II secretion system minor pseudopilin GspK [Dasania marina]|uniref:type II secretion system minor pseudopilin GspK n=1 Tax=Dasania marina TaxID=471499 RepID=UPI0030D8A8FA